MELTPLKYQELWHREPPRTSQRQALIRLLEPSRPELGVAGMILLALLFGGNRAGKSMAGLMLSAAMAAGEDAYIDTPHGRVYWVRHWMARNAIPTHLIPKGPATVWLGSSTFDLACDTVRPTMTCTSRRITYTVPSGSLNCPSSRLPRCLFGRLADQSGRALMMLTPLRGKRDWLYLEYVKQVALAAFLANTAKPFPIPANWLRWVGVDWGARAPHVVWAAEDRKTGRLYVYRELAWRRVRGLGPDRPAVCRP